jgi:uncharacterized protein YkwD
MAQAILRATRAAGMPLLALALALLGGAGVASAQAADRDGATTAATAATAARGDAASVRVTSRTNALRRQNGLNEVVANDALTAAAAGFARHMARTGSYGHDADGRTPADRARAQGYDLCLVDENIGYVQRGVPLSADDVADAFYDGWRKSPSHRRNMLDPDATQTGVGLAQSASGRWYGVQMFGRPRSESITFSITNTGARSAFHYRLGERAFTLPARVTRTHTLCREARLSAADGTERPLAPKDGARYAAVPHHEGWRLERE